jgi:Methyltransferase domain
MRSPNAQYNLAAPDSLPSRIAGRARRRMFDRFLDLTAIGAEHTILDVGATSDKLYDHSNYLESWYPHKHRITAVGIDDASFLAARHPGLRFVKADGRALPFADHSFDFVHSSAVLEHVGSLAKQRLFIGELFRVCRRGAFLTTPNRWFPVEFHTVLPLIHWLPKPQFRALLRGLGHEFFASEDNLNLMTRGELRRLCRDLAIADATISCVRLGGIASNLILFAPRAEALRPAPST